MEILQKQLNKLWDKYTKLEGKVIFAKKKQRKKKQKRKTILFSPILGKSKGFKYPIIWEKTYIKLFFIIFFYGNNKDIIIFKFLFI